MLPRQTKRIDTGLSAGVVVLPPSVSPLVIVWERVAVAIVEGLAGNPDNDRPWSAALNI